MAAAIWPLAIVAPAIQVYLGCFARSFKEAQGYAVFLLVPVASLGVVSALGQTSTQGWMSAVPILAQYTLGAEVLAGRVPPPLTFAFATLNALAVASIFVVLATRHFNGERMLSRL
jgi:sodium transport system permease protein